jgi:hypothetical protein
MSSLASFPFSVRCCHTEQDTEVPTFLVAGHETYVIFLP